MAPYTPHQGTFFAHRVTLEGNSEDALAQSLSTARVDMNPHQVDAALFALASPLTKGVLLADEVGLGKTIEAALVIAQKWAERRRRVLLIVPASLRKQWSQELTEKFSLPSTIIEARSYNDAVKRGLARPFDQEGCVTITSYEFAATKADDIKHGAWDLVIFDEAHRLRNVYKQGTSVRAKKLREATRPHFKVLLTATPLQNSLMELYGLVSVLDEHFFGDEASFRSTYVNGSGGKNALLFLRKRLESICKRTLRRQVQQAGLIRYTERCPLTIQFDPSPKEVELYMAVSAYLQRRDTIAFGERPNALVTLVVRKILGSSTFALADTLAKIVARLKTKQLPSTEVLDDYDVVAETAEELNEGGEAEAPELPVDPRKLASEIAELEGYRQLALDIGQNQKGIELVKALPQALDEIAGKGGQRKAVIFTESVRTQRYLADLLTAQSYTDDIVLLNGQNSDPASKAIYEEWLARHRGTDAISGSRTADMKAAVVEAFREKKSILIATESGAEGINLQFCSLVVNFDLPWNPQRVEQRIGRCHRYGQKIDVTVVNFLNLKNRAEQRVHELLSEKFKLFQGVFGASDEVLGAIERGVDIERRILEIVQSARNETEINAAFDLLQEELQTQISEQVLDARKRLLETVDERVVAQLKTRQGEIRRHMSDFDRQLLLVARAELHGINFHADDERRFDWKGETYTTEWPMADERGWRFFRLTEGTLAIETVEKAKSRSFDGASALRFDLASYHGGRLVDVEALRGKSGWLKVAKLRIATPALTREQLVLAMQTDDGEEVHREIAERLLQVPAIDGGSATPMLKEALAAIEERQRRSLLEMAEQQNADWLDQENEKLDAYADDLERSFETEVKALEVEIREAKKALRGSQLAMAEKLTEKRRIMAPDGSLWITVDDNEAHYLKVMCDELFGRNNFVSNAVWQKKYTVANDAKWLSENHDHILVYALNKETWRPYRLARSAEMDGRYRNPDNHPKGAWKSTPLYAKRTGSEKEQKFRFVFKNGVVWSPPRGTSPRFPEAALREMDENNEIWFGTDGTATPSRKTFLKELKVSGPPAPTVWLHTEVGNNHEAREEVKAINPEDPFATPKPERLLKRILDLATMPGDLVLDSFAGSGTTGAVAHKMGRRWIMVEWGSHCESHILPRLRKIIDGTELGGITESVGWDGGGGFRYYTLAPSLLEKDRWGNWVINSNYNASMLAQAVCKLMGFTYEPSEQHYWMHGRSTESDFIFVTTQALTHEQLKGISEEVGEERTLLICCKAFRSQSLDAFPNLTVRKIPHAVMRKCEWGKDDYSLNVANLPMSSPETEEPEPVPDSSRSSKALQPDLFVGGQK